MNALNTLTMEDLNQDQKELVDIIGLEAFKKLVKHYGGAAIYIPKLDTVERQKRNTEIRDQYYKGKGLKYLANKYKLTETQIRTILDDIYIRKSQHICIGQISMSDILD